MPVDRHVWSGSISEAAIPAYPCPRCKKGHLALKADTLSVVEPNHSAQQHSNDDFDADWIEERFSMLLTCSNAACGEVVAVSGQGGFNRMQFYDGESGLEDDVTVHELYPRSMFPAPPLFPISAKLPKPVRGQLDLAFQLFWADLSASTSRLRTSLEFVLDEQGIPRTVLGKDGKPVWLNLQTRIDKYEKNFANADNAETMKALRIVGNLGTHGDEVDRDSYFDLLDVYEVAILEIYEKTSQVLKAKKLGLIALGN